MKLKKLLALGLSVVMAASLMIGCGSKPSGGDTTKPAGETTAAGSSAAAGENSGAGAADEEKITCELLVWSPAEDQAEDQGAWLQTMCEKFNAEHPNWDITFKYGVTNEAEVAKMIVQDPDASADVFMFSNDQLMDLIPAGAIAKLGGETKTYVESANSPAIVDSVTVDGNLYGVPFTTNTWFMYYDKSAFTEEEAGNLNTMLEKGKISFPLTNSWYLASFYLANGCTLFGDGTDAEAGVDYSGEKAVKVTEFLVDMVENPNFVVDVDGSGIAGIRDGSIKAMFSGSWDYASVKEALGDNFAARELPTVNYGDGDKQMLAFAGSKAIGVNANCKYPQVAVALAKYLGSPEGQREHYATRNIIPCNTELLEDEAIKNDILVVAQNNTFNNTSIIQPFIAPMVNYWENTDNFGKSLRNKEVTRENAAEKTEAYNTAMNSSVVE